MVQSSTRQDPKERLFRIGTSGWNYEHWRNVLYPSTLPPGNWFGYYSRLFDTVEINNTFYQLPNETYAVLEEHEICLCVHDMLAHHPRRVTGPAVYVRFHGSGGRYAGSYRRDRLQRWARWMQETASEKRTVYAYFNNDADGNAVRNALTLRDLLEADR